MPFFLLVHQMPFPIHGAEFQVRVVMRYRVLREPNNWEMFTAVLARILLRYQRQHHQQHLHPMPTLMHHLQ